MVLNIIAHTIKIPMLICGGFHSTILKVKNIKLLQHRLKSKSYQ